MKQLGWSQIDPHHSIAKIPLLFTFPPVETLMKELTRLNSPHAYRIIYLGPRWQDSLIFHKKYAPNNYPFDEKGIIKMSSLYSQTMMHNQFYKNQIYYRAFEGMNPTLTLHEQLIFESRFEGGNLDCVVKVSDNQYDLFLRIDSNTRGNIYWFYFAMRNCPNNQRIKLNICNLTKSDTHYAKNLNPFVYSSTNPKWAQLNSTKTTFAQKRLRYKFLYQKLSMRKFYELSFEIEAKGEEQIKFAYCIPYTYSDLTKDIKMLSSVAQIGSLGNSLTGVCIPMVMIGKPSVEQCKPVLLITGRVHPGQSNSSIIVSNLMKHICFSPQSEYLRKKVLTVIIPMLNPDGVIMGNSRCGASGKDINRQFKSRSKFMFPEVYHLKKMVEKISQTHDIQLYLDFHGHSRKKNMFVFGPDYNLTQPEYYKSRAFPKLLANQTNIFRYYSCSYTISNDKKSTARAVMLNQMMIPLVFTVETSLGFYVDYSQHKTAVFSEQKYAQLGQCTAIALKQFFEENEQYENFLKVKRKEKNQFAEQIKQAALVATPSKNQRKGQKQSIVKMQTERQQLKDTREQRQIKFFKIFNEINKLEQKRQKEQKAQRPVQSEDESDSHDSDEQLEKEKLKQFSSMVTDCLEEQIRRKETKISEFVTFQMKKQQSEKMKRLSLRKRKEAKFKEETLLFNEYVEDQIKSSNQRKQVRTSVRSRAPKRQDIFQPRNFEKRYSEGYSKQRSSLKEQQNPKERSYLLAGHQLLDQELGFLPSQERKSSKMNIKMFNFSKIVSRAPQNRQIRIIKSPGQGHRYSKSLQIEYPLNRTTEPQQTRTNEEIKSRAEPRKFTIQDTKNKAKSLFPASFYRIKYHNNQRKRHLNQKQTIFSDFDQHQYNAIVKSSRHSTLNTNKRKDQSISYDNQNKKGHLTKRIRGLPFD